MELPEHWATLTDEQQKEYIRKEKRNEKDRARRAAERARKIANGTYRPPLWKTDEINENVRANIASIAGNLELPPEVVATLDKRSLYLAYLEKGLRRSQAAEKTGVSYSTVKYWRKTDDKFREAEVEREEAHLDEIEDRLRNVIADNATPRDMIQYLERRRPDIWAPKNKVEHEVTLHYTGSDAERRGRIAELIRLHNLELDIVDAEVVEPLELTPGSPVQSEG